MGDLPQTPRVTAKYLSNFQNQVVRILGKVTELRGESATIDAGGSIQLILNRESHFAKGHAAEIVGKVQNDANLSVRVLASMDFGTDIDYAAADALAELTHKYPSLFYDRD